MDKGFQWIWRVVLLILVFYACMKLSKISKETEDSSRILDRAVR